jgi:chromosomal replication initiator protein
MNTKNWDYSVFWKEAVKHIRAELSEQEFEMWFKNVGLADSGKEEITLAVPSSFYRDQLKQRYMPLIRDTLYDLIGQSIEVKFTVKKQQPQTGGSKPPASDTQEGEQLNGQAQDNSGNGSRAKPTISTGSSERVHPDLRPDYTFNNFVIGDNNSLAANACIAISKNPGSSYNPCLVYGGVGLGKTHLIQSVGNYVFQEFDKARIVYVTAETFTNEFIQAIQDRKNHQFKNKYRNVDVLLIDDIHFLQDKNQTQEELFHTFNALYDANKQMVFTCDRPVSELKNLADRLRSRFERGLNVDLQPPNFETRFAILKSKVEEKGIPIDDQVIELICKNINTNVRDLEAALTKLSAYADLLGKRITVDIAKEQLKDVFSNPKQSNINIEMIQRVVADYFNLSAYDLRGKKRTKAIAFPRQIAMYITREITEFSTTEVGLEFGGRDHTTVMHACQRIESRMQTDPFLEPMIQGLIRNIKEYGTKS